MIGEGKGNKEIANKLNIDCETVKTHIKVIIKKLHLAGFAELRNQANELKRGIKNTPFSI
ncbi:MAG: LuxR C-terminal-related transcriptional regulator [Melioribacteraceae bacterium]|nr:LuxR C-terminal-related transcriptional regulator [Saprospiraceae bacterium]MCF8356609.1 LuxR C-terminal-related transcriptional regulator [Melioribacteraceae bacterium]MCF8395993.1 LuxR C-terminal-related transcriptional regulator [Melioribacteraceae bacterium]